MALNYDTTDFVDGDLQEQKPAQTANDPAQSSRAPTRQEVDGRVADAHQKLSELKRAQEELERQRAALEETRRRQSEFETGRQEMIHHLTRGLGLLEEAEFTSRRDAEHLSKALVDLRDALAKIEAIREDSWTRDNFEVELTRALTVLENARMEWNSARLKLPVLSGSAQQGKDGSAEANSSEQQSLKSLSNLSLAELCRLGLALTWPLALVAALGLGCLLAVLLRR